MKNNLVKQVPDALSVTRARMLEFTLEGVYPAELLSKRDFFSNKVASNLSDWLLSHGWHKYPAALGPASGWKYEVGCTSAPTLSLREAVLSNAAHLVEEHLVSIGYHVVRSKLGHVWPNRSHAVLSPGEYTKNKRRPKRGKRWMSLRVAAREAGLFPRQQELIQHGVHHLRKTTGISRRLSSVSC